MEARRVAASVEADVHDVEVVLANNDRVTLRVGDTFLKVDADQTRVDVEVQAIAMVPVPTPEILWRKSPVLALAAVPGRALGRLGEPSTAPPAAWTAVGTALRRLHDAPLPPWPGPTIDELSGRLVDECGWLVANGVLPPEVVTRNRHLAEAVRRTWTPAFIHGDLHVEHVFIDGDSVTGIIDWSEASQGDALFDLATLTLGHHEQLEDVIAGYGVDVDRDLVRAWWSWRCLVVGCDQGRFRTAGSDRDCSAGLDQRPNVVHVVPLTSTVRGCRSEVGIEPDPDNGLEVVSAAPCQHIRAIAAGRPRRVARQRLPASPRPDPRDLR